jgi:hypothetical protein
VPVLFDPDFAFDRQYFSIPAGGVQFRALDLNRKNFGVAQNT